jgi:hypothetical protein
LFWGTTELERGIPPAFYGSFKSTEYTSTSPWFTVTVEVEIFEGTPVIHVEEEERIC